MRVFLLVSLLLAGCASQRPMAHSSDLPPDTLMAVGSIAFLDLHGSRPEDVIISDQHVAKPVPFLPAEKFGVLMLSPGYVLVIIKGHAGAPDRETAYHVICTQVADELKNVTELLRGIPGIQVDVFADVVRISGALTRPETVVNDYDRIYQAETLFTCLNTVTIADSLYEAAALKMQQEIEKLDGASEVKVRVLNGTFFLEGEAANAVVRERAEAITTTLLPPMKGSAAIRANAIALGAKKYSVRNFIQVNERVPSSSCPKN
jgi:hypothetical protein